MKDSIHPRWEKALELAFLFQMIDETAPEEKDFLSVGRCRTPACHAERFLVFHPEAYIEEEEFLPNHFSKSLMARHLGFGSHEGILNWASLHPEIWGNNDGHLMFNSNNAFGKSYNQGVTLEDISDKWFEVAERLYNMQDLRNTNGL